MVTSLPGHAGAHAVAVAQRYGVTSLFTLSGGHVFPLYDGAVKADPPVRLVDVRHEQTAVFAAEATARLTRTPGLAAVTAGPGVTNSISAVTGAWFNGAPLVVLGGRAPDYLWGKGALQEMDHVPLLAPVTKRAWTEHAVAGVAASVDEAFRLADPSLLDIADEHGDRVRQQIMSVFPNFVMQRTQNIMAVRHFVPRGVGQTDLHWTYLGYADDAPDLRTRRLRQLNLAGPAGFVSMEDGCIGGFVERGAATASGRTSVVEMGGAGTEGQDTRATEAAIRGFWRQWRATVGV